MYFEVLPILDVMLEFYSAERTPQRFQEYLKLIYDRQQDSLKLPLPFFNPMAREHVPEQLQNLRALEAESIMGQCCLEVNQQLDTFNLPEDLSFQVCLSLSDDLKGGWTNQFSTHFGNSFLPKGLFNHQYCTPLFWTSETHDSALARQRTLETLWRTVFQLKNGFALDLAEHLEQEAFVQQQLDWKPGHIEYSLMNQVKSTFLKNKNSESQATLIAFLYGDVAAEELGYSPLGLAPYQGFELAQLLLNM